MKIHGFRAFAAAGVVLMTVVAAGAQGTQAGAAGEYAKHFEALRKLSIEVAERCQRRSLGSGRIRNRWILGR